ncbi:MAG: glycosyltransferase family 39 protein, partial [Armatimonadota bacterium]
MGKRREWMAVVGLLVAGGALLAWGTWRAPLADVDEPRFAGASRHMLASGDWLHTYFNGEPRWQKPILFYWLQAGSFAAFGVSEFAARLPAWLFATLSGLLLYAFARRFCGHPAGLFALVAWFSLPQTHIWAKLGIVDTTLTFLTTAAALAAFAGAERGARRGLWYIAAGAAMGLAALTKGPVGLAIPAGVYLCYVLLEPRARRELLSPWPYVALATALAAAAPWYVLQYCDYGAVYLEEFFGQENIERFGGGARGAGIPGIIWWLFVFLVCAFPCSALLPWAAGSTVGGSVPDDGRSRRLGKFLTIWVALVLIVWSLSAARHPQYIMAIYPPVALLCGRFLSDRWYARPRGGLAPGIAAAVCGSLVAAGLAYGSLRFLGQVR